MLYRVEFALIFRVPDSRKVKIRKSFKSCKFVGGIYKSSAFLRFLSAFRSLFLVHVSAKEKGRELKL